MMSSDATPEEQRNRNTRLIVRPVEEAHFLNCLFDELYKLKDHPEICNSVLSNVLSALAYCVIYLVLSSKREYSRGHLIQNLRQIPDEASSKWPEELINRYRAALSQLEKYRGEISLDRSEQVFQWEQIKSLIFCPINDLEIVVEETREGIDLLVEDLLQLINIGSNLYILDNYLLNTKEISINYLPIFKEIEETSKSRSFTEDSSTRLTLYGMSGYELCKKKSAKSRT